MENSLTISNLSNKQVELIFNLLQTCLDSRMTDNEKYSLKKKIHYITEGGHYNKELADEQISKFDHEGIGKGPYYTWNEIEKYYDKKKTTYNLYDFGVALNMITSDYYQLLHKWFQGNSYTDKYVELTYNWLNDDDNPFGNEKIWKYFNSK